MKQYLSRTSKWLFNRYCRFKKVSIAGKCNVSGRWPSIRNEGSFNMGSGVIFRSFRTKTAITVLEDGRLEIGANCFINDGVNICCSTEIKIGRDTKIADWAVLYDTDFHEIEPSREVHKERIVIGRNVWIGARAIILPGADIGDHSVIAAGAIVRGHIPPQSVAAGIPAKVIKSFTCDPDWVRK